MTNRCQVVPWYNSKEWNKVYAHVSNPSTDKEHALNTLLIWKARCPTLPSGIESTLSLLQVHVQDTKQIIELADDQLLRLAYSSAIMRFVNHMLDSETIKGSSLYQAAKNLGVPDWIVDLRHDTAHSNNLPHLTLLREACTISLQWLQQNYWEKYKPNIQDYISGQKDTFDGDENKIAAVINLCTTLSICAHHNCKIKHLSEIPNIETRQSIVNDIKELIGDQIDMSNLETVSITSIIHILTKQFKNISTAPEAFTIVNEAILGEDSLFLSRDLLYFFSANDFKHKNRLNNSYVQCFEVLLTFLHTNDLLLQFVLALIKITQSSESKHFKAFLAALWISEILVALKRCQEFAHKLKMSDSKLSKKKKNLIPLYHHWFPSPRGNNLILDVEKSIPKELMDIKFIQPIVGTYNPYLIYFIRDLTNLIVPPLPKAVADVVYKLAELISAPDNFLPSSSTIYTVDDLVMTSAPTHKDSECVIINDPKQVGNAHKEEEQEQRIVSGIWRLASRNHNWGSCPIGQLPWQLINDDSTMERKS